MMSDPLVTIIMAAYNSDQFIAAAIASALEQEYQNIELIVVNDGSTDDTAQVLTTFTDPRLVVLSVERNRGVSHARNRALDLAHGEYVCFLDADDHMPARSISSRSEVLMRDPGLSFVDGAVEFYDAQMQQVTRKWTPTFVGEPLERLVRFDPACFFGNTWLVRREAIGTARFDTGLSHSEDLQFYIRISPGRRYGYTRETVLDYRITGTSSMSRLDNLERSYRSMLAWMWRHPELVPRTALPEAGYRVRRMMSGAYWKAGRPLKALWALR